MKNIAILGSTGSIGTQCLDVIRQNPEEYHASVLSCSNRIEKLESQIQEFHPEICVVKNEKDCKYLSQKYPKLQVLWGTEGLITAASQGGDLVLNSLMGISGLLPTYYAISNKKDVALANKETLVAGGEIIMEAVAKNGIEFLPVDSEHSAIFQCLEGNRGRSIKKILLTASGGPFRGFTLEQLETVTLEEALNHPKWSMGNKITIDSATMMNKGFEVIEAKWLFGVDEDHIEILVHPQSILHSAVEFQDTSIIGQMGVPDMRIPISLALGYPHRIPTANQGLDMFKEGSNLTFEKPDTKVFKCIELARQASKAGGSYPVVLNGANEVLVDLFLHKKISFIDIQNTIEKILENHKPSYNLSLDDIMEIDRDIRDYTYSIHKL